MDVWDFTFEISAILLPCELAATCHYMSNKKEKKGWKLEAMQTHTHIFYSVSVVLGFLLSLWANTCSLSETQREVTQGKKLKYDSVSFSPEDGAALLIWTWTLKGTLRLRKMKKHTKGHFPKISNSIWATHWLTIMFCNTVLYLYTTLTERQWHLGLAHIFVSIFYLFIYLTKAAFSI